MSSKGEILYCNCCGSKCYWEKNCSDAINKSQCDIWLYEQERIDSGCTKIVCGKVSLHTSFNLYY